MISVIKKQLLDIIYKKYKIKLNSEDISFTLTPDIKLGDISFNTYKLAKKIKEDPKDIASFISKNFKLPDVSISQAGAYLNLKFATKLPKYKLFKKRKKKEVILIEFCSPNTNKPLHLGHLRNIILGEVLSRIYEENGFVVKRLCLYNDRGIHIIKPIVVYLLYHKGENPKVLGIKGDKYLGDLYVEFEKKSQKNKELIELAYEFLRKWEKGDKKILDVWKMSRNWCIKGFEETFKILGLKFDKFYYESKIYKRGKEIVKKMYKKGIVYKNRKGAYEIDLENYGLGKKVLLREDETGIYITCDLGLAERKIKDYKNFKLSIYITGREQEHYFKVLFKILEIFGFKNVKNYQHVLYGMVNLPSGKMKSREGNVVELDEFLEDVMKLIKEEYPNSQKLKDKDIFKIAKASIITYFLKVHPKKDITFDPKKSIDIKGETGPYILYTYVRCLGILKKVKNSKFKIKNFEFEDIKEIREILRRVLLIDSFLENSMKNNDPSTLLNLLLEICKEFNSFYEKFPILNEKDKSKKIIRIEFVKLVKEIIEKLTSILWIDLVEKM